LFHCLPGEFEIVAKIFLDEGKVLLEADVAVLVGIEQIEDDDEIFAGKFESDEEAAFGDEQDELFKGDSAGSPDLAVGGLVSSVEEDLDEVYGEDDGKKFIEGDAVFLRAEEGEI
jgi:hypothetical protein